MVSDRSSKSSLLVVVLLFLTAELLLSFDYMPLVFGETVNKTTKISRALERAIEYGAKIEHSGFRADLFLDLVPTYVEVGDMKKAIAIANREDSTRERILKKICQKQIELGQVEEALKTAAMIEWAGWKVDVLKTIAQELVKQEKKREALKLISQAKKAALFEEDIGYQYSKADDILSLAEIQWAAQDEKGARFTIRQAIKLSKIRPNQDSLGEYLFFSAVANMYARQGDKESMLAMVKRIPLADDKDSALRLASKAQAESGAIQGALDTVGMIEGRWDKDYALYGIARIQAKADDIQGALKTTTAISHHMEYKSFALLHIAEAQEARSNRETALQTLAMAETVARAIPEADERAEVFAVIAQTQGKIGDTKSAKKTIGKALHLVKHIKDTDLPVGALAKIIQAQIKAGDINGALKSADVMGPSFHNFRVNWQIAEAQALTGDYEGAVATAQKSHPGERGLWRACTFQQIARIQVQQGQEREAEEWAAGLDFDTDVAWAFLGIAEGMIAQKRKITED